MMNKLMLSCKKATELVDKSTELKLSLKERLQLRFHIALCDGCKSYQKQSAFLDNLFRWNCINNPEPKINHIENNELKEQIISKIENFPGID